VVMIEIRRMTESDIESFHRCLDAVARERRFLTRLVVGQRRVRHLDFADRPRVFGKRRIARDQRRTFRGRRAARASAPAVSFGKYEDFGAPRQMRWILRNRRELARVGAR